MLIIDIDHVSGFDGKERKYSGRRYGIGVVIGNTPVDDVNSG